MAASPTTTSTCPRSCVTDRLIRVSVRIRRVTTTRAGGVSVAPYDSFNLGDHVGDDPAAVAANRARLGRAIGLGAQRVVWMNQVHGDRVEVVTAPRRAPVDATDAIVTAAWLRRAASDPALWAPPALTPAIARSEGWTFGVI